MRISWEIRHTTLGTDNGLGKSAAATDRPDHTHAAASDRPLHLVSTTATPQTATPHKQQPPRSKSPEKASENAALTQQILDAIEDIQQYNLFIHQTEQPHKLKREITTNFLKALTPNQRLINRILEDHQNDIEHHHHQVNIQPGHNSSYREKITLADVQQVLAGEGS